MFWHFNVKRKLLLVDKGSSRGEKGEGGREDIYITDLLSIKWLKFIKQLNHIEILSDQVRVRYADQSENEEEEENLCNRGCRVLWMMELSFSLSFAQCFMYLDTRCEK